VSFIQVFWYLVLVCETKQTNLIALGSFRSGVPNLGYISPRAVVPNRWVAEEFLWGRKQQLQ